MAEEKHVDREGLLNKFKELGIENIVTVEHPEVILKV